MAGGAPLEAPPGRVPGPLDHVRRPERPAGRRRRFRLQQEGLGAHRPRRQRQPLERSRPTFEFRRDAGVIRFNGRFEEGWGEGTYRFEGDTRFLKALDLANVEDIDEDELLAMVVHDVRTDWVKGLQQAGVMQTSTAGELLAMQIHGVTPEFVRELTRAGLPEPAGRQADRAPGPRRHAGVHPRHALEGVVATDLDDLISFRVHNVSPAFINDLDKLGYDHVEPDDLVSMKIHGVTPAFIQSMVDVGPQGHGRGRPGGFPDPRRG